MFYETLWFYVAGAGLAVWGLMALFATMGAFWLGYLGCIYFNCSFISASSAFCRLLGEGELLALLCLRLMSIGLLSIWLACLTNLGCFILYSSAAAVPPKPPDLESAFALALTNMGEETSMGGAPTAVLSPPSKEVC